MATKKINSRLITRNDTYENWSTNNPVLLKGEIAVVTNADLGASCYSVTGSTYIVVGDGVTAFNDLKPVSKDVFDSLSDHIKANEEAISEIQNSDTLIDDDYYWGFDGSKGKKLVQKTGKESTDSLIEFSNEDAGPKILINGASGYSTSIEGNSIRLTGSISGSDYASISSSGIKFQYGSDSTSISTSGIEYQYGSNSASIKLDNLAGYQTWDFSTPTSGTFTFPNKSSGTGLGASGHFILATTNETTELDSKIDTTKTDLEAKIKEQVASVFRFKGTVADLTALNAIENPTIGDVYHVTDNHTEYVYATVDGSETASWEELGSSGLYALKTDLEAEVAERQELETSLDAEKNRALREEADIRANLTTETTNRETAEQTLADRIAAIEAATTPVDGTTIVRNEITKIISVGIIEEDNLSETIKTKLNTTTDTDSSLTIDDNNKLTVNEVSTDKLIQGTDTLVLDGGSSN